VIDCPPDFARTAADYARHRAGFPPELDVHDRWVIRSAVEQDIPAVLDLWATAGSLPSVTDSPDGLARLLAADSQALLVAELDGVLAGSLIAAWDGWRGSFYRLAGAPEHRIVALVAGDQQGVSAAISGLDASIADLALA
jgi:hypothetical protein